MGGNTTLTIGPDKKLKQHAYFKIPTAQTAQENCVSHNGWLIPVPGRDIMVQGWYQGGVDVIDFTDPDKPIRDRVLRPRPGRRTAARRRWPATAAPRPAARGTIGGSWGAYYYNGMIYSSEMARGLDILELTPREHLSANEIAAAKLVRIERVQPAEPAEASCGRRRSRWCARTSTSSCATTGSPAARTTAIDAALDAAEQADGRGASHRADAARRAGGQGRRGREGRGERAHDGGRDPRSGRGDEVGGTERFGTAVDAATSDPRQKRGSFALEARRRLSTGCGSLGGKVD